MSILDTLLSRIGYSPTPPKRAQRDFTAASQNRLFNDWIINGASRNEKIRRGLVTMRARSRDLCENDDYARKFVGLCKTNISGPFGVKNVMDIVDPNGKPDTVANKIVQDAWLTWCKKENCTVTGQLSMADVQHVIIETLPQDGEFLVRKVRGFDNPFRFALQLLPVDCLNEELNKDLPNGNKIRMGVERDVWKRPVAYHIRTEDTSDIFYSLQADTKNERLPASDVIHGFIPTSINQLRGIPWFHTAAPGMHMLGGYEEAAVVAARSGAANMGFLEKTPDANGSYVADDEDESGNKINDFSPGTIEALPAGYKFSASDFDYPHAQFPSFCKHVLRRISAGLQVSYNSLSGDLESVNYSSIRAGLLEERDVWILLQNWFIGHFLADVFKDWLTMSIATRQVALPQAKFEKFNRPCFVGRRWPWVDPMKDIMAKKEAIAAGLDTRTDTIAEMGGDRREVDRTLKEENDEAAKAGLKFDVATDPSLLIEDPNPPAPGEA